MQLLGLFLASISSTFAWPCPYRNDGRGCDYDGCYGICRPPFLNDWGDLECQMPWGSIYACPPPLCVVRPGLICPAERGAAQECSPGQYQPRDGWPWNWVSCQGCPPGTYSGRASGSCYQCPAGSYAPNWQSTGCLTCPAGSSCPLGSANPALCLMGTYSLAAANACLQCPAGTYVSVVGSTWYKDCPPGFSCPPGSISPIICTLGTYSPGKSANCFKCSYGSYTANSGSSSCMQCPANPFMGSSDDGACLCEAGYFAA